MNCVKNFMARKMNTLKPAQEIRGNGKVRRRLPELALPHLMQLRSQTTKALPPRRRLEITVESTPRAEVPRPVKIIHAG